MWQACSPRPEAAVGEQCTAEGSCKGGKLVRTAACLRDEGATCLAKKTQEGAYCTLRTDITTGRSVRKNEECPLPGLQHNQSYA